jgi:hypothetical protein
MEKEQFVDLENPWWLLREDADTRIVQGRESLAHNLGWDLTWYQVQTRVEELYQGIERNGYQLLTDLDQVGDDVEKQVKWLDELLTLTGESESHETEGAEGEEVRWDENWGMLVSTDANGTYKFALSDDRQTVRPGTAWMTVEEANEVKARMAAEESHETESESGQGSHTWDSDWGMFLRFADGKYSYALSNILADAPGVATPAGQPDGTWHQSPEAAAAARQEVIEMKQTFESLAADSQVEAVTPEIVEQVLRDPNFKENMAAAEAELNRLLEEAMSEESES